MFINPNLNSLIRWAAYLARLRQHPKKLKISPFRPRNQEQEMARRRQQITRHGSSYWRPIWGQTFKW